MIMIEGDMIPLDEFVFLYHLKESKEFGYYELVPWDKKARLIVNLPSLFQYWKSRYFLCLVTVGRPFRTTPGVIFLDCSVGGGRVSLVHPLPFLFFWWRDPSLFCPALNLTLFSFLLPS